jgi:hypothetical protein
VWWFCPKRAVGCALVHSQVACCATWREDVRAMSWAVLAGQCWKLYAMLGVGDSSLRGKLYGEKIRLVVSGEGAKRKPLPGGQQ